MTALTVNGSAVAATTLAAAGKLFNATGGTSGNTSTKVGSGTLFKQVFAKGTSTNQTGVASIPAPTDSNFNGWMWDVTTLEGQRLAAGTWTPTIHLLASTGTTVTPTVAWYKRSSGGVYTSIGSVAGLSIALTTSSQALTFTPPSLALMDFATGDKLVMWLWVNQTAGGATNSTISVVEATSSSSAGVASEAQAVTPGYAPIPVALSVTMAGTGTLSVPPGWGSLYAATVLANNPIRYYRLDESSGTTILDNGSQGQNGTLHGGITLSQTGLLTGDSDTAELFDGSTGYIATANSASVGGLTALSVECWVKFTALSDYYRLVSSDDTQNSHVGFDAYIDAPSTSANIIIGNGTTAVFGWQTPALSIGTRYHIVFTYDGANIRTYLNGTLVGSPVAQTGTIGTPLGPITIGRNGTVAFGYMPGIIDEVSVYNVALTAGQVTTHYIAGTFSGTFAGVGTLTGTLSTAGAGALAAECDGVGTLAGTLSLATALNTTFAGLGTLSETLSANTALADTFTGAGTLSGTAQLAAALSTTCTGVGTLSETLTATTSLTTSMVGVGTLSGTFSLSTALADTFAGSGTLSATLSSTGGVSLACTMAGAGVLTPAALSQSTALSVTSAGIGTLSGALSLNTSLSTTFAGTGILASTLMLSTSLASTVAGASTLTGAFSLHVALFLSCLGISTFSGTLVMGNLASIVQKDQPRLLTTQRMSVLSTRDGTVILYTRDGTATLKERG